MSIIQNSLDPDILRAQAATVRWKSRCFTLTTEGNTFQEILQMFPKNCAKTTAEVSAVNA